MPALFGARNPNHKRAVKALKKAEAMLVVSQMAREHRTHHEISKESGLSLRSVQRYLAERKQFCVEQSKANVDELIAEQLDRYNDVYREAMAAWRRSQGEIKTLSVEDSGGESSSNGKKKTTTRTEFQAGESAYLEKAIAAVSKICDLKGLNAPRRTEIEANLSALSIHEEIITVRENATAPGAGEIPG